MNEFEKLDAILKKVKRHNGQLTYRYIFTNNHFTEKLPKQELIEIIEKLEKDNYVKCTEKDYDIIYSLSFEGRLFLKRGGYSKSESVKKIKNIANKLIIAINIINIFAIITLTYFTYKSTEKANDNKDEVKKLNREIEHLKCVNEKLRPITAISQ